MTNDICRLSQNHLNLFSTCPRKFQHIYLDQFTSPCTTQQQTNLSLGNRFHRFMQQRELGVPIDDILATDQALQDSFSAIAAAAPTIIYPQAETSRYPENRRTLLHGNFLLTGIYDLLILSKNQAQIIDWKTYPKPPQEETLANNWQTRLYLYLLAKTSSYLPESITFTYWFIKVPHKPTAATFSYSQEQHEATEKELTQLLNQLSDYWHKYETNKQPFPKVKESQSQTYCFKCPFNAACGRCQESDNFKPSEIEEILI